jgi:hypothetical protein
MDWRERVVTHFANYEYDRRRPHIDESALAEFINLGNGDTESARGFIERYGVFAIEDLSRRRLLPWAVRRYFDAKGAGVPFGTPVAGFWGSHREISDLVDLLQAIRCGSAKEAKAVVLRISSPLQFQETELTGSWLKRALSLRLLLANRGLKGMKFRLIEDRGCVLPMVCGYDVKTALIWVAVCGGRDLVRRRCGNPSCGRYFFGTRAWSRFCSTNCKCLVNMKRWREAKKNRGE